MCTKLKQLRKDEKLYKAFYEKSVTFFSKILYPTEEILIGGEKNFHVSVITELVLWLNDTFSMVTSKVPNLEHVYMRPEVTQTGLKSQTVLKCRSVYMAIYMDISLLQLSKQ